MNIKNQLTAVSTALSSINRFDDWNFGITDKLNPAHITAYSNAIKELNLTQAQAVLSTKGFTEAQQEHILVAAGLKASEQAISGVTIQRTLEEAGLDATISGRILTETGLIDAQTNELIVTKSLTAEQLRAALANEKIVGTKAEAIIASATQTGANTAEAISFDGLALSIGLATKALIKFLFTNPVGWAILGASAIFGLVKACNAYTKKLDETNTKASGLANTLSQMNKDFAEGSKSINNLKDRYYELSKGVSDLGINQSLTNTEYDEYKEIVSQLSNIMPSLSTIFNEQGEQIGFAKGKLEDLNAEYNKYKQNLAIQNLTKGNDNGDTLQDVVDAYNNATRTGNAGFWGETLGRYKTVYAPWADASKELYSPKTAIATLKHIQQMSQKELYDTMYWNTVRGLVKDPYIAAYKDLLGVDFDDIGAMDDAGFEKFRKGIDGKIQAYETELQNQNNWFKQALSDVFKTDDSFWQALSSEEQGNISAFITSLDNNAIKSLDLFDADGKIAVDKMYGFAQQLVEAMKDEDVSKAFSELLTFDADKSTQPVSEMIASLRGQIEDLSNKTPISSNVWIKFLNLDGIEEEYNNSINRVKTILTDKY